MHVQALRRSGNGIHSVYSVTAQRVLGVDFAGAFLIGLPREAPCICNICSTATNFHLMQVEGQLTDLQLLFLGRISIPNVLPICIGYQGLIYGLPCIDSRTNAASH